MSGPTVRGRPLHAGRAEAPAIVLGEPLSLWGGMDAATGMIIDARHPRRGASLAGRVVVMPGGRGSSSSASVLAEAARAGVAPAAILLGEPDLILATGAAVAEELYGVTIPVVVADAAALAALGPPADGEVLHVTADGGVRRA